MAANFSDTLKDLRVKVGMSQKEAYEALGVKQSTFSSWETGKSEPPGDVLMKLLQMYKVSDVLGAFGYNGYNEDGSIKLNLPESEMIKKYRALDKRGKEKVDTLLNWETERMQEIQRIKDSLKTEAAAEIIPMARRLPIPLSLQPVSAGRGAYLGPEEFETIFVNENSLTKCASFAVCVSGNSMEPSYSDGDILLIQRADDIQIGEIGVFTLDGEGYVKERGDGELISLNPEYDPIPMNEGVRCNGRVIGILDPDWIVDKNY